ncbi:hypothetical protein GCM10010398_33110 [Streptomyces fimbriatus]
MCTGSGTPPSASATTSLTVFDPTSTTLIRMARGYPLTARANGRGAADDEDTPYV